MIVRGEQAVERLRNVLHIVEHEDSFCHETVVEWVTCGETTRATNMVCNAFTQEDSEKVQPAGIELVRNDLVNSQDFGHGAFWCAAPRCVVEERCNRPSCDSLKERVVIVSQVVCGDAA